MGGGESGGCDGMAGSGDSEERKRKAGSTNLKDLIDNTLDLRWKSKKRGVAPPGFEPGRCG